jgi:hypothetical protein
MLRTKICLACTQNLLEQRSGSVVLSLRDLGVEYAPSLWPAESEISMIAIGIHVKQTYINFVFNLIQFQHIIQAAV